MYLLLPKIAQKPKYGFSDLFLFKEQTAEQFELHQKVVPEGYQPL